MRSTMESRGVEVPEDDILIRETLDRLILDSIQLQLANLYGVRIPDQQLDESMTRLAQQNGLTLSSSVWPSSNRGKATPRRGKGSGMIGDPARAARQRHAQYQYIGAGNR